MSSIAKIIFLPKETAVQHFTIVDKYSGWKMSTKYYQEDGYVMTDNGDVSTINANYWIKLKPATGYKFNSVYKSNSSGNSNYGEFEIDSDGCVTVYPWQNGTAIYINNYLYLDIVESSGYTFTTELENCTCNNKDDYEKDSSIHVDVTCNTDYYFDVAPVATMNGVETSLTLSDDKKTATLDIVITGNIQLTAKAIHTPYALETNLTHCTCNYDTTIPYGKTNVIITADDGYMMNGYVSYTVNHITHTTDNFKENDTICTFTVDVQSDVEITAQAVKRTKKISKFANLYKVDTDILNQLSEVRFYDTSGSSAQKVDYGSFINNLFNLPFEIPANMIEDSADVQLGNYDTNVPAPVLNNYIFVVDLGKIQVPEKYNNVYDYKDVTCILHLPYCDNIILNSEYVINQTISVQYKIDLYTGYCTVNIKSSFINDIFASKTFKIGSKIPFMQEQTNSIVSSIDTVLYNDLKQAYIEVNRNIPYNVNTVFGCETVDFGTLENYAGYIEVSDIILNINATNDEKKEIETLLRNGVYINDVNMNK